MWSSEFRQVLVDRRISVKALASTEKCVESSSDTLGTLICVAKQLDEPVGAGEVGADVGQNSHNNDTTAHPLLSDDARKQPVVLGYYSTPVLSFLIVRPITTPKTYAS